MPISQKLKRQRIALTVELQEVNEKFTPRHTQLMKSQLKNSNQTLIKVYPSLLSAERETSHRRPAHFIPHVKGDMILRIMILVGFNL